MNDDEDRRIKAGTIVRTADPAVARTACRSSSALSRSTTVTPRFVGVWNASTSYGIDNLNRFTGREIAGASNTKANRSTGDAGVWSSDTISPWSAAWSPKWYCLQVLFERERWPRGAYHRARLMHLQSHLNEFICHFNRPSPRHTGFGSLFEIAFRPRPISHSLLTQPGIETKAAAIDRRSSSCRIFGFWLLDHRPGEFVAPVRTREFARLCVFHVLTTGSTNGGYN